MPSKNPAQRLRDIVDNIDGIEMFTVGMELEAFAADRKTLLSSAPGDCVGSVAQAARDHERYHLLVRILHSG